MSHCQNGVYCVFPRDCMCRCAGCNPLRPGQVTWDGFGQVPGTAMPLEPAEAKVAFKIERPAYLPWRAWGILDEFDTLYEIREKV